MTSGSELRSIAAAMPARCAATAAMRPVAPAFSTCLRDTPLWVTVLFMVVSPSRRLPMETVGLAPVAVPVLFLLVVEVVPHDGAVHHGELRLDVLDRLVGHSRRVEVVGAQHRQIGFLA